MREHLATLVEEFLRHRNESAIVAHRGNRRHPTSYGELAELAGRFSAELARRKVAPGERVVLWGANSAEWIACFFGCLLRGVIVVPLDAAGTPGFTLRVIRDVSPKLIVGDAGLLSSLPLDALGEADQMRLATISQVLPREPLYTVSEAVQQHTPFQIVFTSGTTSEPRGIVHTHRNVLVTVAPIEQEMQRYLRYERWVHPLRFLHTLPLSHVFGQFMGLWLPALLGTEVHFPDSFEAASMAAMIRRERISVLIAVPRVLQLLRAHIIPRFAGLPAAIEASSGEKAWRRWWRFRKVHRALGWKFWAVVSGGATLPAEVEMFWNRLGFAVIQGYGMTETSALITLNHPFNIRPGTIGKPLPGREIKLTDDGEILVRGEMLAGATWQGGTMRPRNEEWLATGDVARQSETGELTFLGRKGDVIVTGAAMNIHPEDLEAALLQQAGVRACVVVGCETPAGAEPVAVVVFAGSDAEMQAAVTASNRGLAEFQQIRRVLRWAYLQLPHTSTGKLRRRQVAAWACAQLHGSQTAAGTMASGDELLALIAESTGQPVPQHKASVDALRLSEDLHLDSLGRVQLQSLLEQRLGLEVEDDAIASVSSVGELRQLAQQVSLRVTTSDQSPAPQSSGAPQTSVLPALASDEHRYPRWPWSWPVRMLRVLFVEALMRPAVWLLASPHIVQSSGTYPDGPLLIVANHVTAYDGALVLYGLPGKLRRRVAVAMSGEMLLDLRRGRDQGSWVLNLLAPLAYGLITALFNVFPLPRARGFRRSFAHAGEAMDRGYGVLIFPEGTRSRDGRMHAFRPGIGLLAKQSGVPVLPVGLVGLGALRRSGRGWFRSGGLTVRIGDVVHVREEETAAAVTLRLEHALRGLLNEQLED